MPTNSKISQATELAITTVGAKSGKLVIAEAIKKLQNQHHDKVISFVSGTMNQIIKLKQQRSELDQHIEFQEKRLRMIELVTVDGRVQFKDYTLNG